MASSRDDKLLEAAGGHRTCGRTRDQRDWVRTGAREIRGHCPQSAPVRVAARGQRKLRLSARAYHRVLKIVRTITNLTDGGNLDPSHVAEAVQYLMLESP